MTTSERTQPKSPKPGSRSRAAKVEAPPAVSPPSVASPLTDFDIYLFNEGTHVRVYEKLGAHLTKVDGKAGAAFAVWAPNADVVSVIGEFNKWDPEATPLHPRGSSGIWQGFVPGIRQGTLYKYSIKPR